MSDNVVNPWPDPAATAAASEISSLRARLAAVEAERDSLGANVDRLVDENNALKDSLDRWKTEARGMGKYTRETADTLARALGHPDAQHAGLPIGSVVSVEVAKLAAAELARLTTENQRQANVIENLKVRASVRATAAHARYDHETERYALDDLIIIERAVPSLNGDPE